MHEFITLFLHGAQCIVHTMHSSRIRPSCASPIHWLVTQAWFCIKDLIICPFMDPSNIRRNRSKVFKACSTWKLLCFTHSESFLNKIGCNKFQSFSNLKKIIINMDQKYNNIYISCFSDHLISQKLFAPFWLFKITHSGSSRIHSHSFMIHIESNF